MSFRVLTWESIGWEELDASSTNLLTKNSELKEELLRPLLLEFLQSVNLDQLFLDRLEDMDLKSSLVEGSLSLS